MSEVVTEEVQSAARQGESEESHRQGARLRRLLGEHWLGLLGAGIVVGFVLVAALAPVLAPYSPSQESLASQFLPPAWEAHGSMHHILGTDALGRDVLSRMIFGTRVSLGVPALALAIAAPAGTLIGLISGLYGGWLDLIVMRWVDIQLAFPSLLFAISVLAILPSSAVTVAIVLGVTGWIWFARIVRSRALALREREFVLAARLFGASNTRIVLRHLFPNVLPVVLVLITQAGAFYVVAESGLSFLGIGSPISQPSWGGIMHDGQPYLTMAWWIETLPGVAIFLLVCGMGFIGGWLGDIFEGRTGRGG